MNPCTGKPVMMVTIIIKMVAMPSVKSKKVGNAHQMLLDKDLNALKCHQSNAETESLKKEKNAMMATNIQMMVAVQTVRLNQDGNVEEIQATVSINLSVEML